MVDATSYPEHNFPHSLPSNLLVGLGTLLCRVTGFGRILALAYAIGLSGLSDVYNVANTTPNIIYELMLGGILSATLLPTFVRSLKDNDHRAISAVLSVTAVLLGILTVAMILAAPFIMDLYSVTRRDNPYQFHEVGVDLVRYFMPQIFFYGLISLATALLNAQHKFALPAYAPILNNTVVIGLLLALPHIFDGAVTLDFAIQHHPLVAYLGLGTTLGIFVSALVLVPAILKSGITLSFAPEWNHPAVLAVLRLSGWTLGYVIANQVALYLVSLLALQQEGWLTAYQTAFAFFVLPHGLLAMTITTTFMPYIARDAAEGDMAGYCRKMVQGLRMLMLLMIPASVGYIMIANPLLVTLLHHGQFTMDDAHLTGATLFMFAVGLFPFSAYLFLMRGFYALSDTKTPFKINLAENAANIAFAFPLAWMLGVEGLSLSYSLAYCLAAVIGFIALNKRVGGKMADDGLQDYAARILLAAAVMALAVSIVLYCTSSAAEWIQIAASVCCGVLVYGAAVMFMKLVDVRSLLRR
jgi:putative peptidoglycan lipid II flippase